MGIKEAKEKVNEIFTRYGGQVPEASRELFQANKNLILAMEKEHPGKLVFFKWWPEKGEDRITPFIKGETRICNFCSNYVVPTDSPNYDKFVEVVKHFDRSGTAVIDEVNDAAEKCGGEVTIWS